MRGAIGTHGNAAVRAGNFHVEIGVANGGADLIPGAAGSEDAVGAGDGDEAFAGQAGGHAHHVLLGDADAENAAVTLRVLALKIGNPDGAGNVRMQGYHAGIFPGALQASAEAHARRVHIHFHGIAGVPPVFEHELGDAIFGFVRDFDGVCGSARERGKSGVRSSGRAFSNCSFFGGVPCQLASFSMKETPLPLMVRARITVGRPGVSRAREKASRIFAMSWPSMEMTFQPKAEYFSARGSTFITSFTQPSICKRLTSIMPQRLSRL